MPGVPWCRCPRGPPRTPGTVRVYLLDVHAQGSETLAVPSLGQMNSTRAQAMPLFPLGAPSGCCAPRRHLILHVLPALSPHLERTSRADAGEASCCGLYSHVDAFLRPSQILVYKAEKILFKIFFLYHLCCCEIGYLARIWANQVFRWSRLSFQSQHGSVRWVTGLPWGVGAQDRHPQAAAVGLSHWGRWLAQ